ncbi:hypothetical protein SETIT_8G247000v2 [Setaria italica]|uniref:Gnk2-homologous domain-containing protein n=1 Tax=Setaria italica TaxID=4555 RepID=A0A368SBB7_SETIT|nr:cysteine-rich repeat secretory protein 38-like [Setaria italica]RCV39735.1 hypothetical protein SETIT_8G247000v2 [Setaria italica]
MDSARLLLLIAVASLGGAAAADDHLVFSNYTCSAPGNYTSNSPYARNLARLLAPLSRPAAVDNWLFHQITVYGTTTPDDQASGLAMCFADSAPDRCRTCLATVSSAHALFPACDHSRNVSFISSDGCVIRYAAGGVTPFFVSSAADDASGARLVLRSRTQAADAAAMRDARRVLLSRLAESAAGDDDRRFAAGNQGYMDAAGRGTWQVIYGMAQCTRDLPPAECSGCLLDHLSVMYRDASVTNSTEASVMGLTCYLTYQMNKPIHIAGVALPPAAQPSETPTGSAPPPPVVKTTVLIAALAAAAVTLFSVGV